jgi:peptide/nickel transport system substrate-binding protein
MSSAIAGIPDTLAQTQAPRKGGTLRISNGGDPPDLDIHQSPTYLAQMIGAPCYSTLHRADPRDFSKLIPDLAEKTDISADGRTVTFQLRDGVQFHNGMPLTAEDVAYSLDRIRNPPRGIVSPRKGLLVNIEAIETRGPLTVVVRLVQPQADFLFLASNPFNVIMPKKVVEPLDAQGQGMRRQIIGTGPFRLTQAVDGQIYELVRFDKYFGPPPNLDRIQFFPIKGEIERSAALQGKRIDACFYFNTDSVMSSLRKLPGMTVSRRPSPTYINLIPNMARKPFDDPRAREALSLAIDREAFIRVMGPLSGAAFHSLGLMPPGSPYSMTAEEMKQYPGYDTLPGLKGDIVANRKRAMALLEQAGVPKGFKLVLPARADLPQFRDSSINIASQLKTVGFDATVDIRDASAFYAIEAKGDFHVVVHSISMGGSTPDQILGEGYTSNGGRNYGFWKDDALDALFKRQSAERDPKKRAEYLRLFQARLLKENYQINLAWNSAFIAYWNTLNGFIPANDTYTNMQMDKVWLGA